MIDFDSLSQTPVKDIAAPLRWRYFHFLRGVDNLNKLDKPPHEWFNNPGRNIPPYSDKDLEERLLTWDDLQPGHFEAMVERRGKKIPQNAEELFGLQEEEFNTLFADKETKPETKGADDGMGLEKEIREEELLAMAAERGIVPLVEACRRLGQEGWVSEQAAMVTAGRIAIGERAPTRSRG